jgi:hypothetical protein
MKAILTALMFAAHLLAAASGAGANDLNFQVFAAPDREATVEPIESIAFSVFEPAVKAQPGLVEPLPASVFAVFSYPAPQPQPQPKPQPINPPPPQPVATNVGIPTCGYFFDPYDGRIRWRCFY